MMVAITAYLGGKYLRTLAWYNNYFVFNAKVEIPILYSYYNSSVVSQLFIAWIPTSFLNL